MKKYSISFLICMLCGISVAGANWQYNTNRTRDSWSGDDGMRLVVSVRGGISRGSAKIKNEIGGLTGNYMRNNSNGEIVTLAWYDASFPDGNTNYTDAGYAYLGNLPAAENYKDFAFTAGVSAGFTMPDVPQWRVEFGFDHISESDYNAHPLFDGELTTSLGYTFQAQSGGAQSTLASDIYSVMAFYDFFDGLRKPLKQMIPYIGIGVGYANTKTVLQLTDSYGDLTYMAPLSSFGTVDSTSGTIQFNKSTTQTSNLAPMAGVGISYGLSEKMFLDFGARVMYLPKVKWQLSSSDEEQHRDWFNAEKMWYINALCGLRIEF